MRRVLWCLVAVALEGGRLSAQVPAGPDTAAPRVPDTLSAPIPGSGLAAGAAPAEGPPPGKSVGLAMGLSALIPGAGQFYNESYWKVPVVVGLAAYFISEIVRAQGLYKQYRDEFAASAEGDAVGDPRLLALREFYKDERDSFAWYYLILWVVNIADAYVDASLFGFDVSGDLSLRALPLPSTPAATRLTLRFHF